MSIGRSIIVAFAWFWSLVFVNQASQAQPIDLTTAASLPGATEGDIWPQWRGPTRDGVFTGPTWPNSLAEDRLKRMWRVELGPGYSGPIVARDRVFTVETRDKAEEVVRAFDRQTGRPLWETVWKGAMTVPFFAQSNGSWVRATPAYDGQRLYVAGMRDVLVCLDAKTGKQLWRVDFTERYDAPLPAFGFVCSPLVVGDLVMVQAGASFVAVNKLTGETVWRTLADSGGMYGSAFSSPTLATIQGVPQILVQTRAELAGVTPGSGDVLWRRKVKAFRGMNILTPTVFEDAVFTSTYGGRSQLIRPTRDEAGQWAASQVWDNRTQGYMTSPVVIDGHAYLYLRAERFTCIELKTGEIKWTTSDRFGKYWSLLAQGNRILALDARGGLYLIKATPEGFEKIDGRRIADQETWAHLAMAGNHLFVRELRAITGYVWE